jgi:opacity protein-like surface antigen
MDLLNNRITGCNLGTSNHYLSRFMRTITAILTISALFSVSDTLLAGEAVAPMDTEVAPTIDNDAWRFKITPYILIPTLSGNIKTSGGGDIDLPAGNAESDWQFSVPLALDLGKGRWGVGLEFFYLGYSGKAALDDEALIDQRLDFDATLTHTKAFAYYRALENEKHLLDFYAGANFIYFKFETELSGLFNGSADSSTTWVDPVIGARYHYNINDKWRIFSRGELGAGDSSVTWDAMLGINYVLSDHWAFGAGYRSIGLDFSSSEADYNIQLNGPIISASYTF